MGVEQGREDLPNQIHISLHCLGCLTGNSAKPPRSLGVFEKLHKGRIEFSQMELLGEEGNYSFPRNRGSFARGVVNAEPRLKV